MKTIVLLLILIATEVCAQIPESVKDEINLRVEHHHNPSIVVGIYEDGQFSYHSKGWQHIEKQIPANSKTVYEIGSITKTFTGLLLAQMVEEQQVQLADAVQAHWPDPFSLVDSAGHAISIKQLATHTSGLPRLPSNLNTFVKDPYASYDRDQLVAAVTKEKVSKAGSNYAYSNFGAGLLGETMAMIEQADYQDLIKHKILQPLNLTQTYMQLSEVPEAVLAQGYNGNKEAEAWQFKALAGAGAVRSSIEDLLNYGVAHLESKLNNPSENSLRTAMQLATTAHFQQGNLKVGLGWHINNEGIIWHNGGTAGFSSIILIDPQQNKVVAGITNSSPSNSIEDIAAHLMNESNPMIDHEFPVEISADQLSQYIGSFKQTSTDKIISFIKKEGQLYFTAPKQPRQQMTFIGNDTFKLSTFKVKFRFNRDDKQQITGLDLDGWGSQQSYKKLVD